MFYRLRRLKFFALSIFLTLFLMGVFYMLSDKKEIDLHPDVKYGKYLFTLINQSINSTYSSDQACHFPILDPFDASIKKFIQHPKPIKCRYKQPRFTYTILNQVHLDKALATKHRLERLTYKTFNRANGSDSSVIFGTWKTFKDMIDLTGSHGIVVRGRYNDTLTYSNVHASVVPTYQKPLQNDSDVKPNVLIIGIDSISRSNAVRNLPLTYRYLMDELGGWEMRGYSKIDDNTFPNILALLTGYKVTVKTSELSLNPATDFADEWPFIWKNFSKNGYTTLLAEEQPGIFSYKARGFKRPPTDVYLRPYLHSINQEPLYTSSTPLCFGNEPESKLILDAIERFITIQQKYRRPYFAFSFLWKTSHDKMNDVEKLDELISEWVQSIHHKGLLNETVFVLMADHGNRFDDIRSTLIGRYEERMPFFFIRTPEFMNHPGIQSSLNANVWKLTCQYDVYETLVDIATGKFGESRKTLFNRGQSLFREVASSRTCSDLSIDEHFCEELVLSLSDPLVNRSVSVMLDEINECLSPVIKLCYPVQLEEIISANKLTANSKVQRNNRWHFNKFIGNTNVTDVIDFVRITIRTRPNNAIFEGIVQHTKESLDENSPITESKTSLGQISRINSYGDSAHCISLTHRELEKLCTCRNYISFIDKPS